MLCQDCKKKPTCVSLCPKAEKYVNKDHVSLRESPQPDTSLDLISYSLDTISHAEIVSYFSEGVVDFPFLTPLQNKILEMFYFRGFTYKQIARAISGNRSSENKNQRAVKHRLTCARKEIVSFFYKENHLK